MTSMACVHFKPEQKIAMKIGKRKFAVVEMGSE